MKTRLRYKRSASGIVLIEAVAYIGLLALIMGLAMAGYVRFEEQSRRFRGVTSDIANAVSAGERWREDIRSATGKIQFDASSGELRIPHSPMPVIYRFAENRVERNGNGMFVPVLSNIAASSMQMATRKHVQSWRWELEFNPRGKNPKLQRLFQFEAVAPEVKQ